MVKKDFFSTNIENRSLDTSIEKREGLIHHELEQKSENTKASLLKALLTTDGSLKKIWVLHEILRSPYRDL
jgi:hypothetical protein